MRLNKDNVYNLVSKSITINNIWQKHTTHAHIAVVIHRGKVLSIATNSVGTRSRGCGYQERTIHAERAALKKVGDTSKLNGAVLVVIRISRGLKEVVNSEPCHSCRCHLEKCIREHGLRQVYYSV